LVPTCPRGTGAKDVVIKRDGEHDEDEDEDEDDVMLLPCRTALLVLCVVFIGMS